MLCDTEYLLQDESGMVTRATANSRILREFDNQLEIYRSLAEVIQGQIERALKRNQISVHAVTSRVKERKSLQKKISKPEKSYRQLTDITDIAGVRIITYFEPDVARIITRIINDDNYDIDWLNSVDKTKGLMPDQFGYLSVHHVLSLREQELGNQANEQFRGLKVEVQTRSILQHAWAEIEHDIGYKTKNALPLQLKRRFYRLAGLLEIADQEFVSIKSGLKKYRRSLWDDIQTSPKGVATDNLSLAVLADKHGLVKEIDGRIAEETGVAVDLAERVDLARSAQILNEVRLDDIGAVLGSMQKDRAGVISFGKEWNNTGGLRPVGVGVAVSSLAFYALARLGDPRQINAILDTVGLSRSGLERDELLRRLWAAYKESE